MILQRCDKFSLCEDAVLTTVRRRLLTERPATAVHAFGVETSAELEPVSERSEERQRLGLLTFSMNG
jgi:hypothetical protein